MDDIKIINDQGYVWSVRIIRKGSKYGQGNCKVHDEDEPLVEFCDCQYELTNLGQLVSRYYVDTIMDHDDTYGLNLQGGVPGWSISAYGMHRIIKWLKETL